MSSAGGNGAFYTRFAPNQGTKDEGPFYSIDGFSFDASRCSPIYGASKTVQPRSYIVYYIMKIQK